MATKTKTYTLLEAGKMYKVVVDPYVRGPTLSLFNPKENCARGDRTWFTEETHNEIVPVFSGYLMALETEIEPEYGAWVLFHEQRLWLRGENFSDLEKVDV